MSAYQSLLERKLDVSQALVEYPLASPFCQKRQNCGKNRENCEGRGPSGKYVCGSWKPRLWWKGEWPPRQSPRQFLRHSDHIPKYVISGKPSICM